MTAPDFVARRLWVAHVASGALVALLTLAAYLTLDRVIALERTSMPTAQMTTQRARIYAALAPAARVALANDERDETTARRLRQARLVQQLDFLRDLGRLIAAGVFATLFFASLAVFAPMARSIGRLTRDAADLARVATTDPLTGMLNRSSFQIRGAIEIQKARRYSRPLSMLMIDADQLPAIEGAHGSSGGETVLKALTSSFFAGTRVSDLLARVDAEQFAILLPETDCAGALLLAERLRAKISNLTVPLDDTLVSCTLSIGVAAAEKDASFLGPTFKRADDALYEAKMRGRNRVVVASAAI